MGGWDAYMMMEEEGRKEGERKAKFEGGVGMGKGCLRECMWEMGKERQKERKRVRKPCKRREGGACCGKWVVGMECRSLRSKELGAEGKDDDEWFWLSTVVMMKSTVVIQNGSDNIPPIARIWNLNRRQ